MLLGETSMQYCRLFRQDKSLYLYVHRPFIGGFLSHPVEGYPSIFGGSTWLRTYPYFLPCAAVALISGVGFLLSVLFFREVYKVKFIHFSIPNLRMERCQSRNASESSTTATTDASSEESISFMSSPSFVPVLNYVILSFLDISFWVLFALFLSTPPLSLSSSRIGLLIGVTGLVNCICAVGLVSWLQERFGPRAVFQVAMVCWSGVYAAFFVIRWLAIRNVKEGVNSSWTFVMVAVVIQLVLFVSGNMAQGTSIQDLALRPLILRSSLYICANSSLDSSIRSRSDKWNSPNMLVFRESFWASGCYIALRSLYRSKGVGRLFSFRNYGMLCICRGLGELAFTRGDMTSMQIGEFLSMGFHIVHWLN